MDLGYIVRINVYFDSQNVRIALEAVLQTLSKKQKKQ